MRSTQEILSSSSGVTVPVSLGVETQGLIKNLLGEVKKFEKDHPGFEPSLVFPKKMECCATSTQLHPEASRLLEEASKCEKIFREGGLKALPGFLLTEGEVKTI